MLMRGSAAGVLLWAAGMTVAVAEPPRAEHGEDAVYGYTDDHGSLVHVQTLDDVPPRLRPFARRLDVPNADASLGSLLATKLAPGENPIVYRYVTKSGATRYTNVLESVPAAQRSAATVDLSHVALNSAVGRDLERLLEKEHTRLASSSSCQQLRAAAEVPLWRKIWDDHGPLVVIAVVAALLVFVTPAMLRRVGGREWARALSMAIPALAALGLFAYATFRASQAMSQLKAKAAPCEQGTWNALAQQDRGVVDRLQLLQHMHVQQEALEKIALEGR